MAGHIAVLRRGAEFEGGSENVRSVLACQMKGLLSSVTRCKKWTRADHLYRGSVRGFCFPQRAKYSIILPHNLMRQRRPRHRYDVQ